MSITLPFFLAGACLLPYTIQTDVVSIDSPVMLTLEKNGQDGEITKHDDFTLELFGETNTNTCSVLTDHSQHRQDRGMRFRPQRYL